MVLLPPCFTDGVIAEPNIFYSCQIVLCQSYLSSEHLSSPFKVKSLFVQADSPKCSFWKVVASSLQHCHAHHCCSVLHWMVASGTQILVTAEAFSFLDITLRFLMTSLTITLPVHGVILGWPLLGRGLLNVLHLYTVCLIVQWCSLLYIFLELG